MYSIAHNKSINAEDLNERTNIVESCEEAMDVI